MKVWKVQETTVNGDEALELELNRLERCEAKVKEVMLVRTYNMCSGTMYVYKIIYTIEEDTEE